MIWAVLGVLTLVACEVFLRLPFRRLVQDVVVNSSKAGRVLRSDRISDQWKEKVLLHYSFKIGSGSLVLALCLVCVVLPFAIAGPFLEGGLTEMSARMMSPPGVVGMLILAAGYILIRRKLGCNPTTP